MTSSYIRFSAVAFAAALLASCGGDKFDNEAPVSPEVEAESSTPESSTDETIEAAGADAQKLIDMCVAEGEIYEICACQIAAVETALGEEDFSQLLAYADADDEDAAEEMLAGIMTEKPEVAMRMATDMMACTSQ